MAGIEFKILFEVRVLHDYYLYGADPDERGHFKSFFDMTVENQYIRLAELLKNGQYDVRNDLDFHVGHLDEKLFKNMRLKLVKTTTGFFVGMQVSRVLTNGGKIRFKPAIPAPKDAFLTIGLSIVNPFFGSISNLRLDRDDDKIYYFTNEGEHDGPSLATPVAQLISGQQYRMGDLANVSGSVKQASMDNNGNARFWSSIAGQGLINQNDRSLSQRQDWFSQLGENFKRPIESSNGNNKDRFH